MTTGDGVSPGDDLGRDLDGSLDNHPDDGPDDDVIERLRRLDPVDVESLPSSRRADAMRTLERILGPDDGTEPS